MSPSDKLANISPAQRRELEGIEARAIAEFRGSFGDLESALGMLRLGHHFGWRVIYLVHSKATVRKYERILGIKVREIFGEDGPSSERSMGFRLSRAFSSFWKVVSGEQKIADRTTIDR